MGNNLLKDLALFLGISFVSILGLTTRKEVEKSPQVIEAESLDSVYSNLRLFHGGIKNDFKNDRDFDGDGINDVYVVGRDGTIYTTQSKTAYSSPKTQDNLFKVRFYKHKKE